MESPTSSRISSHNSKRPRSTNSIRTRLPPQSRAEKACGDQFSPSSSKHKHNAVKRLGMDDVFKLIESSQWKDRKIALDELAAAIGESRKLDVGKTIKYLRTLIVTDTNVLLAAKAVQCITALSNTENFDAHASLLLTVLLEKFKEKKPIIVDAVREATDAIYMNTSFGQIVRYVKISLANQNSGVKAETELFLQRCFTKPFQCLMSKAFWEPLAALLVMNLSYPETTVRENAVKALGTMMKVVGKTDMQPFLHDVPYHQKVKIDKVCDEAVIEWNSSTAAEIPATADLHASEVDNGDRKDQDITASHRKSVSPRSLSTVRRPSISSSTPGKELPRVPHHAYLSMNCRTRQDCSPNRKLYERSGNSFDDKARTSSPHKEQQGFEFHSNKECSSAADKIENLMEAMEEKINSCSLEIRELAPALLREVKTENLRVETVKWNSRLKAMENILKRNHF